MVMMETSTTFTFEELCERQFWVPAECREGCALCGVRFTAFRRKHHCRRCGDVICYACSRKREADLVVLGRARIRVCIACAGRSSGPDHTIEDDYPFHMTDYTIASPPSPPSPPRASPSLEPAGGGVLSHDALERLNALLSPKATADNGSQSVPADVLERLNGLVSPTAIEQTAEPSALDPTWSSVDELQVPWIPTEDLEDNGVVIHSTDEDMISLVTHRQTQILESHELVKHKVTKARARGFVQSVQRIAHLAHPRIVELVGVAWTPTHDLQVLFEHPARGDLRAFLDATNTKPSPRHDLDKLQIALDIIDALVYLHHQSPPVVLGDLASADVMLTSKIRAKLAPFGARTKRQRKEQKRDPHQPQVSPSKIGLAPELVNGSATTPDPASDVYSFGVILTELDGQRAPFADSSDAQGQPLSPAAKLLLLSIGQLRPVFSRKCPPELRKLATDCLAFNPHHRPSASEVSIRLRALVRAYGLEICS